VTFSPDGKLVAVGNRPVTTGPKSRYNDGGYPRRRGA